MAKYTYPQSISTKSFENRKVVFSVKRMKHDKDAQEAYNKALDQVADAGKFIKHANEHVGELVTNMSASSRSKFFKTTDTIVLPLPNTFSDSQSHSWSNETGLLGTAGAAVMDSSVGDAVGGALDTVKMGKIADIARKMTLSIDKTLAASASAIGVRKPLIDPGFYQNYTGSTPRMFNMSWDLIPDSAEEADAIIMIIMKLKQYSSPESTIDGVSLLAPYFFKVEVNNKYLTAMMKLDRCVITNLAVDYGADGSMQQTDDGMPKHISLAITLQEVDMTTANQYSTRPSLPSESKVK